MEQELVALFGAGVVGQWLGKFLGPTLEDLGQDLKVWVQTKRGKNLDDIVTKAAEMTGDRTLTPPHPRTALPLLAAASNEDDASLQAKWAALLASTSLASSDFGALPAFAEILRQMQPVHVQVLDWIYDKTIDRSSPKPQIFRDMTRAVIQPEFRLSHTDYTLLMTDLDRLQLIDSSRFLMTLGWNMQGKYDQFELTALGIRFVEACRPPDFPKSI